MSTSTVSGTNIQDPSGQVLANGTWQLYFTPTYGRPGPFNDGGFSFPHIYSGQLDATGSFSQVGVNRNDTISPAGSLWLFTVTPAVNGQSFQVLINVNSPAFDLTTAINSAISLITVQSSPLARAYKDSELINADGASALYYDETLKVLKVWDAVTATFLPITPNGGSPTFNNITVNGNETVSGTLGVTGKASFKNLDGVLYADQFAGSSFDAQVTAAIAALPSTGAGTIDCRGMSNLTMTANLTISRSNTSIILGQYTVAMGAFGIIIPAGTNNINIEGSVPIGSDPSGITLGTFFTYTGTGSAWSWGDVSGTSYNHRMANISVNISTAGNAAIGIDSSRVYHCVYDSIRVIGKTGVTTQIGLRNNGTVNAPGSQNMLIINPYFSNCFIGTQAIGGNTPPTCNMNQIIGGEFTGPGAGVAGSIGIDVEHGNNNWHFGATVSNYETGMKVASTSGNASMGFIHFESCTTAINFAAGSNNNIIWTDTGNPIVDTPGAAGQNTVHNPNYATGWDFFYGALRAIGTANPSILRHALNIQLAGGLPAATPGGTGGWLAAGTGSPSAMRIYVGDGTGWRLEFSKRTASTDTVLAFIPDTVATAGGPYSVGLVVASGTSTLTANAALAAVTSQAAITTAGTGILTTDAIEWSYATAPTAGDSLCIIQPYVTANNVNFVRSNPTAAAQNVSAIVVNWRVIR